MTTLIFTICARNYIGLAKVLGSSIKKNGPAIDFRIYVVEGIGDKVDHDDESVISAAHALRSTISAVEYANMAFMYNVTEFCTSLKAACFTDGFAEGYDKCIYMDPDIFVAADISHITRELDDCAILITPHLCLPALSDGPRSDRGILATGVYNLGFLALRRSAETLAFLDWWHHRLRGQAFNDHYNALYTDQRWMDFVPCLFSSQAVRIWRSLGCNLAPWNYHERRVECDGDGFVVCTRHPIPGLRDRRDPLLFLHFSGFDFRKILDGTFDQLNLADAEAHSDLAPLYDVYARAIGALAPEMVAHLALPYRFDTFADGSTVLPSHRRLFRIWRERHGNAADPVRVGAGSFHSALSARGLLGRPDAAELAADKATARSIANPDKLLRRARTGFRVLFRALGRARFFFLIRSLNKLSKVEQHYDTFNLDTAQITKASFALDGAAR